MPKPIYNAEKVQKQKKTIGTIAVTLLITVMILSLIFKLSIIVWIPISLVIFAVANLLMRKIGKTQL